MNTLQGEYVYLPLRGRQRKPRLLGVIIGDWGDTVDVFIAGGYKRKYKNRPAIFSTYQLVTMSKSDLVIIAHKR